MRGFPLLAALVLTIVALPDGALAFHEPEWGLSGACVSTDCSGPTILTAKAPNDHVIASWSLSAEHLDGYPDYGVSVTGPIPVPDGDPGTYTWAWQVTVNGPATYRLTMTANVDPSPHGPYSNSFTWTQGVQTN